MSELSDQDVNEIEEIHNRWIAEELAGNSSHVIDFCTDDVKWIPPNAPPLVGKETIAEYLKNNAVDLRHVQVKDVMIRGSGPVAYLTSDYYSRFTVEKATEIQEVTGTHLWVLRKIENGRWQVDLVTWSVWECRLDTAV